MLLGLVFLVTACGDRRAGSRENAKPDSVLILDIDTLRADGLGSYGNPRRTSPTLDRLAASGVRFEWAFAQAPNTPPSQASILTGLYPRRHGRVGDFDLIRPEVETLAERMAAAGLRTAAFVDGGFMAAGTGMERGFATFEDVQGRGFAAIGPMAAEWLEQVGSDPYFLLLHTYDVHSPYAPPEPFRAEFTSDVAAPTAGFEPTSEVLESFRKRRHFDATLRLPPQDVAFARALYDAEIRYVDSEIATLLLAISRLGLDQRTIIVVISDHGEEFAEHGSVLHEKLYATVLRVPLILRVPGGPSNRVVTDLVQTVDLVPTLLELLGIRSRTEFDGRSLVPVVGGESLFRGLGYSESPFFGGERSLALGEWRLLQRQETGRSELYRFRSDPFEQENLASLEAAVVSRLQGLLRPLELDLREAASGSSASLQPAEETIEQLRALGYLQ